MCIIMRMIRPDKRTYDLCFFETYLQLTDEEEEKLMREVDNLLREKEKLLKELTSTYEEKGKEKSKKEVALEMLKKGTNTEFIAEVTHLDMEEIEKLKELTIL